MHDYTHRVDNSPGKSEADIFKVALTGDEILLNAETTVIATTSIDTNLNIFIRMINSMDGIN